MENLKKNSFEFFYWPNKNKCYPLSFPILEGRNSIKALQSSPFQNPVGGTMSFRKDTYLKGCGEKKIIYDWNKMGLDLILRQLEVTQLIGGKSNINQSTQSLQ